MPVRPLLLVDLDGTVTDSLPGIAASLRHALAAVGREWPADRDIRQIAGPPLAETLAGVGLGTEERDRAVAAYRERYDAIGWAENSVFPGMAELLRGLAAEGYRMATATSKLETSARRILDHFDLVEPFEVVAGADLDVGRSAKADVVEYALRRMGVEPVTAGAGGTAEVLMVGDRAHDVEGAAHFGIPCVVVRWGYGSPREWDTARWSAADADELEEVIRGW